MSFEKLVNTISPRLRAIAHRLNGRFTYFDEDDLYQEAVLNLWEKFKGGELQDKTESYILQGAFFFLKNYIRVMCKKTDLNSLSLNTAVQRDGEDQDMVLDDTIFLDPGKRFGFMVVDILVEDVLTCLSPREKKIFLLNLEELTTREIGQKLGISHVMVTKIEKRIREKCKVFKKELM